MTQISPRPGRWALLASLALTLAMLAPGVASAAGTGTIAVCATDSSGNNLTLDSDKAWYQPNGGSIYYVGPVGVSGCREQSLAAGTNVDVWIKYNDTYSQHQSGVVPDGGTLRFDFYTTKVTLEYGHSIAFGGPTGDETWFKQTPATASLELLSDGVNPVHFRLDGTGGAPGRTALLWPTATGPGATFNESLFVLRLLDHTGAGLAGGIADYYLGGWHYNVGTTDANGNYVLALPTGSFAYLSVAMHYNGTRNQQAFAQAVGSIFTFQTALANVKLEDADGNPLDTGSAAYYASVWQPAQNTSGGVTGFEMLPGAYSFAMAYNHTRQQFDGVAISWPTTDVVFQTGRLTAYFQPGSFYWYKSGFYPMTSGAPQEFLPGSVGLQLPVNGCSTPLFAIAAGDHLVKTGIVATLANGANQPLAGGTASLYAGGWQSFTNPTGGNGRTCDTFDGHLGNTTVAMVYNGSRQQITQDAQVNDIYAFTATGVTVELRNHLGNLIDTGTASYYANGWHTIGNTSGGITTAQVLPGSYSFAMTYNGTRQQLNGQVISGANDTVTFQTTDVTVELRDSNGNLMDTGTASYYANGWHTIGNTSGGTTSVEMLPGTYSFAMTYNGTRLQLNGQVISGTTDTVTFQATAVTVELRDSGGNLIDTGTASYYANGWHTIGSTSGGTTTVEMLPGTYSFAMTYLGTREQLNGEVISGTTDTVTFQTGSVHSVSGTATSYYAGGWKPFTNDMELLPGAYWFDFSDATPNTQYTLSGGVSNPIH